ncbi:roquin-1-like isoform X2 [Pieris napi]|uniref:roquin-1-like isoform X2 n=1 Tax=Pieris napi TaxID=78633 RepID=UPI001FBAE606|nr:roquin-1-like isoform X2 [Pieris napi]
MPIQAPHWTDYLNCPVCFREYGLSPRSPVSLGCGHTLCEHCLKQLNRKHCPFDQTVIQGDPEELPVNTALLQLAGYPPPPKPNHPPCIQALPETDRQAYDIIVTCLEQLAVYLKICANNTAGNRLSRPMQRKLVTLLQCAITDEEGRGRAARAARSLGERSVTELILQHQNPQQLSANLWAAVRARGCQFLGPAMQEEVLKLVLLALEDGSPLSRKVLVMFVVQRLERDFPQASKTSIGHVVQLLYRASCFKVSKRECDSSLMQLKEEFRTYETLRREHDAQIVQIATEAGLRIAPDQWSALLYGDTSHKSHMQSIIDKLQTPQSFAQSVQELFIALQRSGDPSQSVVMSLPLDRLANIDPSLDANCPSWQALGDILTAVKDVVSGLVSYLQQQSTGRDANHNQKHLIQEKPDIHTSQQTPPGGASPPQRFMISACRDSDLRSTCPRGNNCNLLHFDDNDLDRFQIHAPVPTYPIRYNNPPPVGHPLNNGSLPPFITPQPMFAPNATRSPPFPVSSQNQFPPNMQPNTSQGGVLLRHPDPLYQSRNVLGMQPSAPMMRTPERDERIRDGSGEPCLNPQIAMRNNMERVMGRENPIGAPGAPFTVPGTGNQGPGAYTGLGLGDVYVSDSSGYGGGMLINPIAINPNNLLMPVPDRPYYGNYPGLLTVVTDESPNFYEGPDAMNFPQYQGPVSTAPISEYSYIPVSQESIYSYDTIGHGQTPVGHGQTPVGHGQTPIGHGPTSVGHGQTPVGHGPTPVGHGPTPVRHGPISVGPAQDFQAPQDPNYPFNNMTIPTDYRDPPGFPPRPHERRAESQWLRSSAFEFDEPVLPWRSPPVEAVNPQPEPMMSRNRRAVGADRTVQLPERPAAPPPPLNPSDESDEHKLEEELMALERRMDTEFKIF